MIFSTLSRPTPLAVTVGVAAALAIAAFSAVGGVSAASAAEPGDDDFLGTAETYVIIATDTVTVAGVDAETQVDGDVGLTSATPGAMELDTSQVNDGAIYVASPTPDPVAQQALADAKIAYGIVAGAGATETVGTANLALASAHVQNGIYVYNPGVYFSGSDLLLDGIITLDGLDNPDAVFIFQASTAALNVGSGSQVLLRGGAQACNVYWQVGSSATIGVGANFVGTVLAATSIYAQTNATISGQLLAGSLNAGEVTLDENTINGQTTCTRTTSRDGTTRVTVRDDEGELTTLSVTPPVTTNPGNTGGAGGTGNTGTTTTGGTTTTNTTTTTARNRLVNTGRDRLVNTGRLANTAVVSNDSTTPLLVSLSGLGVLVGAALLVTARKRRTE